MSYSSKFLELAEPGCGLWVCVCVAGEAGTVGRLL